MTERAQLFEALGHLNTAIASLKAMPLPSGSIRLRLHDTTERAYELKAELIRAIDEAKDDTPAQDGP